VPRVLCYGDSNTWGAATVPRPSGRYDEIERWPGVLRQNLGPGWAIVEEGLNGRTTVHPDPIEGVWLKGSEYLLPCLKSHRPLDVVVIMLGTNDLKRRFNVSAREIAAGVASLIDVTRRAGAGPALGVPRILVICPPPVLDRYGEHSDLAEMFDGGRAKSLALPVQFAEVARLGGADLLDAGAIIQSSEFDGIHLDVDAHQKLGLAVADRLRRILGATGTDGGS
jgi:lysophospholipase L1-like esterase